MEGTRKVAVAPLPLLSNKSLAPLGSIGWIGEKEITEQNSFYFLETTCFQRIEVPSRPANSEVNPENGFFKNKNKNVGTQTDLKDLLQLLHFVGNLLLKVLKMLQRDPQCDELINEGIMWTPSLKTLQPKRQNRQSQKCITYFPHFCFCMKLDNPWPVGSSFQGYFLT